ncbi:MAG: hypothetical protein V8R90_09805 [Eubacterium sp.]
MLKYELQRMLNAVDNPSGKGKEIMFELKFANSHNYYYEDYKLVQVYGQSLINVLSKMVSKKQKST